MFGIALSVAACLRAGTRVDVAWLVGPHPFAGANSADAVALTPGGGRMGKLLNGALDGSLGELAVRPSAVGRVVELEVSTVDALLGGLPHGGAVRCMLVPADALPSGMWSPLIERRSVCLVVRLVDGSVAESAWFDASTIGEASEVARDRFRRGTGVVELVGDEVVSVFVPTPRLVVFGLGAIADALVGAAVLAGWQCDVTGDVDLAVGMAAGLSPIDQLVVMGHEVEPVGRVLAAALDSEVGYIGALGARRMQEQRVDWLAYRGFTDVDRIHGPAGLDIGAVTPGEIAISIVAEALAARHQADRVTR
jgi:xanthine dehydrogenase accessory factor